MSRDLKRYGTSFNWNVAWYKNPIHDRDVSRNILGHKLRLFVVICGWDWTQLPNHCESNASASPQELHLWRLVLLSHKKMHRFEHGNLKNQRLYHTCHENPCNFGAPPAFLTSTPFPVQAFPRGVASAKLLEGWSEENLWPQITDDLWEKFVTATFRCTQMGDVFSKP